MIQFPVQIQQVTPQTMAQAIANANPDEVAGVFNYLGRILEARDVQCTRDELDPSGRALLIKLIGVEAWS